MKLNRVSLAVGLTLLQGLWVSAPRAAYADNEDKHKHDDCRNAEAHCEDNDFSPSFEDSPVRDSFNPTVCLPLSTCEVPNERGTGEEEEEEETEEAPA